MCLQLLGIVNYGGHFEKNENPHRNKRLFPIQICKVILYQLQFIILINYEKKSYALNIKEINLLTQTVKV